MNKWNLDGVSCNTDDVIIFKEFTVATLPDATGGGCVYVSNGAAGDAVLAFSDGTDWLRCDTLAAVSAT